MKMMPGQGKGYVGGEDAKDGTQESRKGSWRLADLA